MAFRDETEALRAHIESLEGELADARDRIAALERDAADAGALRARIADLERELAKHAPRPKPRDDPGRQKRARLGALAVVGVLGAAGVAWFATQGASGPDADETPERGVITLDDEPLLPALSGEAHGDSEPGAGCAGYVSSRPFVTLRTTEPRQTHLWTESGADLVLYVETADGRVICDDDSGQDMNPSLIADLGPGDHHVWVGTYSQGASAPFSLRVDGRSTDEVQLDAEGVPILGNVVVSGVDRHVREGAASGDVPVAATQQGCAGHVPSAPTLGLSVEAPGTARIMARGDEDLVLLVRRPDGTFACDDDAAGDYDPLVIEPLQIGFYRIWVGTFNPGRTGQFQLSVDVDGPEAPGPDAPPRLGRWNLDGESLLSFSERVDARAPVSTTHPECRTLYGSVSADLEIALGESRNVTLSMTSDAPLGVLIEHPDGTQTCDVPTHTTPATWDAGTHRIWVGSPEPGSSASFTLVVQTLGS
ncbi:MAG: hypothetical protein R3B82_04570 [Sandaracinaceae bacterium]